MEDQDYSLFANMSAEKRDALEQLHRSITHEIAESHLTGEQDNANHLSRQRNEVSAGLSFEAVDSEPEAVDPDDHVHHGREDMEDERATLTRELHDAVARKDTYQAGKLDRARNDLTEELYGNGDIVGAGGRSL